MCWVAVPLPAAFAKTWEANPHLTPPFLRPAWTLRQVPRLWPPRGPAHSCSSWNKQPSFYWESSRGLTTACF